MLQRQSDLAVVSRQAVSDSKFSYIAQVAFRALENLIAEEHERERQEVA
jgi:hypothetical protein